MPKHEDKSCPRCGTLFECKLGSITICQCTEIHVSEPVKSFVQNRYDDCLCVKCLRKLQEKYAGTSREKYVEIEPCAK